MNEIGNELMVEKLKSFDTDSYPIRWYKKLTERSEDDKLYQTDTIIYIVHHNKSIFYGKIK